MGNRTIITPRDKQHWLELRAPNLNSTEISALFGANPYLTEFELWHQKKAVLDAIKNGEPIPIVEITENDRMFIGSGLESAIGQMAGKRLGVEIRPYKDYTFLPDSQIGSSFDFCIVKLVDHYSKEYVPRPDDICPVFTHSGPRAEQAITILEIKNVDYLQFRDKWIVNGESDDGLSDIEAPVHIEIQLQVQMLVSGLQTAYLAALVGGNDLKIIRRDAHPDIQADIIERVNEFFASIESNTPPEINYERDAEFLISLYDHAEPDKIYSGDDERIPLLVSAYHEAGKKEKEAQAEKKTCKAQLLEIIGDCEKVKSDSFSISAGVISPTTIQTYERAGYRDFRVFMKKEKL